METPMETEKKYFTFVLQRLRVRLRRTGPATSLSHLQQIDAIRRTLRSAGWPVSIQGSKRINFKVAFAPAISVGYESDAEYCDVDLSTRLDVAQAKADLEKHLPAGFSLLDLRSIPRFSPSLDQSLNIASFEVSSPLLRGTDAAWNKFWAEKNFLVTKKKEDRDVVIDARPLVRSWKLSGEKMELMLRFGPGRTVKPERLIQAVLGLTDDQVRMGTPTCVLEIKRRQLYFEKSNGDLFEP
jgi:radical SAM-linked protein